MTSDYEHDSIELHREANDAYFGSSPYEVSPAPCDEACEEFELDTDIRCLDGSPACRNCGWSVNRHVPKTEEAA